MALRFVCVSDTHGAHRRLGALPPGDVLVHAGDFTRHGAVAEVAECARWLAQQPHAVKVAVPGNHDWALDRGGLRALRESDYKRYWKLFGEEDPEHVVAAASAAFVDVPGLVLLHDAGVTLAGGLTVWGSAWTPRFFDWAFNLERGGREIRDAWAKIPEGADVVVTHGPAAWHGDYVPRVRGNVGCEDLYAALVVRVRPRVAVAGHIHEGHGVTREGPTTFVNASTCDVRYRPVQPPVVFDLEPGTSAPPAFVEPAAGDPYPRQHLHHSSWAPGPKSP